MPVTRGTIAERNGPIIPVPSLHNDVADGRDRRTPGGCNVFGALAVEQVWLWAFPQGKATTIHSMRLCAAISARTSSREWQISFELQLS
jgi:hypothetical protein